jgi:hypothetical protein
MGHDFTPTLAVHDAVRRDLIRFATLLGGNAPIRSDRAALLAGSWAQILARVVDQEQWEESLLWPAARLATPVDQQEPFDRMAEQHGVLVDLLAAGAEQFAAGAATDVTGRRRLADTAERAAVLADRQFAYEERAVLPLLDRYLPESQWAAFVGALHAPSGPFVDPLHLPWLLEGSRPDRVNALLRLVGADTRDAYEREWKHAHRLRAAEVW